MGDYRSYPYARYAGLVRPGLGPFGVPAGAPLLWDKQADEDGGHVVALGDGSVRYWSAVELNQVLEEAGAR
jgi:hypothetical protein